MLWSKRWLCLAAALPVTAFVILNCTSNKDGASNNNTAKFKFSGTLASLSVSGVGAMSNAGQVSHVMAVSTGTADAQRVVSAIGSDGKFTLSVDGSKPWILVFLDSSKTGKNMVLGMYKASSADLDSLAPKEETGSLDLQTVSINSSNQASATVPFADLLTSLGISSATATTLGALDNVCLRYVNPDIDGNGVIDALEDKNFMLDFHIRYDIQKNGSNAKITDMLNAYLPSNNTTVSYSSTGVAVGYSKTFSESTSGSAIFQQDFDGGQGVVTAGNPVTATNPLSFGDNRGFYPNTSSSTLPSGEIRFTVDSTKTMTFTHVTVPSSGELQTPEGRFVPFIKINTSSVSCTSACAISSIDYKWMKKADAGNWTEPTLEELATVVSESGGYFNFRRQMDNTKNIGFKIPVTSLSGSVSWDKTNFHIQDTTDAEFAATTTAMVCNIGLSYDDKLGMRYFINIQQETGATCP